MVACAIGTVPLKPAKHWRTVALSKSFKFLALKWAAGKGHGGGAPGATGMHGLTDGVAALAHVDW